MVRLPATKELYNPTLQALHNLGGSGTIHQINAEVAKLLQLAGKQRRGHRGRLRRARSHLKIYGLLENPSRVVWTLTAAGQNTEQVDPDDVQRVRRQSAEQGIQEKNDSLASGEATAIFDGDEETEMTKKSLPTYQEMINPTLQALHHLGGSGKKAEVSNNVVKILQLTDEQLGIRYDSGSSVFGNLLNKARLYLVKVGLLESPSRGVWTLTEKGRNTKWVNPDDVTRVKAARIKEKREQKESDSPFSGEATAIFDGDEETEMSQVPIPTQKELYNPTLQVLHNLGGSGTNQEIYDEIVKIMNLTDEQTQILHPGGSGVIRTEVGYRVGWAKTYLKKVGLLENPRLAVWALTEKGRSTRQVNPDEVGRTVTQMIKEKREQKARVQKESVSLPAAKDADDSLAQPKELSVEEVVASLSGWRDELSDILYGMSPPAFERLFLHISGMEEVHITGRSSDDTIEGFGIVGSGLFSVRVLFRCMRGNRLINKDEVADFRRAVSLGRANKGVLVTTGNFTQEAMREASRNSAPEIDLMDGERLIDKLKELSLGVKTEKVVVERVIIDRDWFQNIQL